MRLSPLQEMEMMKLIVTASVSISSLLAAVIGMLIALYKWSPEQHFKVLTWYIAFVEIISSATALVAFLNLAQGEAWIYFYQIYALAVILFGLTILAVPTGIVFVVSKVFPLRWSR